MKHEQAVRINDHLIIAHEAMKKARMAIADLGKDERLRFDGSLYGLLLEMEWQLLLPIYDQFPDLMSLELHEELPPPTSELAWNDVRLPRAVTEAALDEIIMVAPEAAMAKGRKASGRRRETLHGAYLADQP
jgi:hypothetical protein